MGSWNVRTLLDIRGETDRPKRRTALVAHELRRYNVDLAALSETRLSGEDSLTESGEGYSFFWKGLPEGARRLHGVGFAIKTSLLQHIPEMPVGISERLMTWRLPLIKGRYITVLSAYAPTLDADDQVKDQFYSTLDTALQNIPHNDKILLLGDFNARVGAEHNIWEGVLGKHGIGKSNNNGLRLLTLCSGYHLSITNTCFQMKDKFKTSWQHPRSKHWHLLDYVIVRQSGRKDVLITRAMRGADCWTDHRLIRCKLHLSIRPLHPRRRPSRKLNCNTLKNPETSASFKDTVTAKLRNLSSPLDTEDTTAESKWKGFHTAVYESAIEVVGFSRKRNQDWFDENAADIHNLLSEKRHAHDALLSNPHSQSHKTRLKNIRSQTQKILRNMENEWWKKKAHEIQQYADTNNSHGFYDAIKSAYGPQRRNITPVRSADGNTLFKDSQQITNRWAEHFSSLLNLANPSTPETLDVIPNLPLLNHLDEPPQLPEILAAIQGLKNNKSPGPDGIPAECYKHGGAQLAESLHALISTIWATETVPQDLKDANIVTIFKKKGDRAVCGNSRGISLLAVAGKILSKVMLTRLVHQLTEDLLPETQCGFRKERSTTDMIFAARQIQEKCREQNKDLFMAFIDLSKAFDTVNRELLWLLLGKIGVPPKFKTVLRQLHDGMQARILVGGLQSEPFNVSMGVKQGCVLAVTKVLHSIIGEEAGIGVRYRLDGNLFNIRRLQANSKTSITRVLELQYADDCALLAHDPAHLQQTLNTIAEVYRSLGLKINAEKTEVIAQYAEPPDELPQFYINEDPIKTVTDFKYLGSILQSTCQIDLEVQARINHASSAFGRLRKKVFCNNNLKNITKTAVYHAICVSTLLYSSETWTPYRRHIKQLENFHTTCLQRILGLSWENRVTREELYHRANTTSVETILAQRHLRWLGHAIRLPDHRLPKQILYGQLLEGNRSAGGPKKRFKDHSKDLLKKCNIQPTILEHVAADRPLWRATSHQGLDHLESTLNRRRAELRARRHQQVQEIPPPNGGHPCRDCGKICASRIGLHSHMRWHQRQRR